MIMDRLKIMEERYAIEERGLVWMISAQTEAKVPWSTKKMKTKDKITQTDPKDKLAIKSTSASLTSTADKDTVTDPGQSTSDCALSSWSPNPCNSK